MKNAIFNKNFWFLVKKDWRQQSLRRVARDLNIFCIFFREGIVSLIILGYAWQVLRRGHAPPPPFWIGLIPAKFVNMNLSKAQQMTNKYVNRSTLEHYMGQSIQEWTK